jgi:hypothetical protein
VRTGDRLRTANEIAHETEQIGHGVMADLTTQREVLLRTQDKVKIVLQIFQIYFKIILVK